jgi:hypothetical protein
MMRRLTTGKVLLYDVYARDDIKTRVPHNLSREDMGLTFRSIDSSFPNPYPIWYGGEFIAGNNIVLRDVSSEMYRLFKQLQLTVPSDGWQMTNGSGFFDNDEFFSSYYFNRSSARNVDCGDLLRRFQPSAAVSASPSLADVPTLEFGHFPGEKAWSLRHLFFEAVNLRSDFWTISQSDFPEYLCQFLGLPRKSRGLEPPPALLTPSSWLSLKIRSLMRRLRLNQ